MAGESFPQARTRPRWGKHFIELFGRRSGRQDESSLGNSFAFGRGEDQDFAVETDWQKLKELAVSEIERTVEELPKPLAEEARKLPVTFEKRPNAGLQRDGIEADTLGLFTGAEFADSAGAVLPAQIILFLENLWVFAEGDETVFSEEVRTTFLHELGHFFGLDEDDLAERGLE
jgi:predicted Zn-dependent protease with MMP-like domain